MPRGELRSEAIALLRHGHNKRRPRARGHDLRRQIPNMVPISERPAEIEERLIPGHWEGDTIKGKYNRSAVGTLVERSTLFPLLARMNGTEAEAAVEGFIAETAGRRPVIPARTVPAISGDRHMCLAGARILPHHPATGRRRVVALARCRLCKLAGKLRQASLPRRKSRTCCTATAMEQRSSRRPCS
jgi:hypothetical protein